MSAFRWALGLIFAAFFLAAHGVSWAGGGQPWVLVDTEDATLTVLSDENQVLARFEGISIGSGGVARIHRRGDETTPLGIFHVAWIDHRSRYDTFFGLDYPSERVARSAYAEGIVSGAERDAIVDALRERRLPPQNTALGGYLGIHGVGHADSGIHEAVNWTDGCVALTNRQIRQLSRWVRVGTQVMIR